MTRADAIARANPALSALARGLVPAVMYLGLLLGAALVNIAPLCADAASAVRALILRRALGQRPTGHPHTYNVKSAGPVPEMVAPGENAYITKPQWGSLSPCIVATSSRAWSSSRR